MFGELNELISETQRYDARGRIGERIHELGGKLLHELRSPSVKANLNLHTVMATTLRNLRAVESSMALRRDIHDICNRLPGAWPKGISMAAGA